MSEKQILLTYKLLSMLAIASISITFTSCDRTKNKYIIPSSELWQVKKGSVYDGDTFRVVKGDRELKIRMCGIDAPEKKPKLGIESRDYLKSLLSKDNDRVSIVVTDTDRYGRTVAEIFVSDGDKEIFVNGEMVRSGMAYDYKRY